MKAFLSRTKDGLGVIVGRLSAPNRVRYENEGNIKEFDLIGNVVDTEYNDVFMVGKQVDENTFEVQKMESIPDFDEKLFGLVGTGEAGNMYVLAIPEAQVDRIEDKVSENGKPYKLIHAQFAKNDYFHISVFGEFRKDTLNSCYVFVLWEDPKVEVSEHGSGYAVKKIKGRYARATQLLS